MRLTIVLPTFNERENLRQLVPALFALPLDLSLLIVDDNSPDGTGQAAEELALQYPNRMAVLHRTEARGLGSAYRAGFQQALQGSADVIGQMDCDFSHPPARLPEMMARLENCDIVIGSRYVTGGSVDHQWPLWRKGLSRWGNFYGRTILGLPMRDVTGGFRLWRRAALASLPMQDIRSSGYVFLIEMAYVAHKMGYTFCETPIHFADRTWGVSKMNWRVQFEAAWRVWWVRNAHRNLRPPSSLV